MTDSMRFCTGMDLDYIQNLPPEQAGRMLKDLDGKPMSSEQVKTLAAIMKAQGKVILTPACDHLDKQGYCLGHED